MNQNTNDRRLPQIDPDTFSALNTLDAFVGKAPLTRAEHSEANRCFQHLVVTLENLQAVVKKQANEMAELASRPKPETLPNPKVTECVTEAIEEVYGNGKK